MPVYPEFSAERASAHRWRMDAIADAVSAFLTFVLATAFVVLVGAGGLMLLFVSAR